MLEVRLVMKINSKVKIHNRYCINVTFKNEIEEHIFLNDIVTYLGKFLPVNCLITDLDTSCVAYEEYFNRGNYYVFDRVTLLSIFAFDLNQADIQNVISNWCYYTIDAMFSLGVIDSELKYQKLDKTYQFKLMPVVITQVLDYSLEINLEHCYFEKLSKFFCN